MAAPAPLRELQAVLVKYEHEIDEPDTVRFIAKLREGGLIADGEWQDVLRWLDDAMGYLKKGRPCDKQGSMTIDADPRNADWIRIVRAQRLAGYRMPHWAALWLWWIGHDREDGAYWKQVGDAAKRMKYARFEESRRSHAEE